MPSSTFSPEWHLVHQESSLISSCLFKGLTDLRHANISNKGLFYIAFYNLAIGIERLLKLTLIIEYMKSNGFSAPSSGYIRKLGHKLFDLLEECQKRGQRQGISCDLKFEGQPIKTSILKLLNEYSIGLRYYNLDSLSNRISQDEDPLSMWNVIVQDIYRNEIPQKSRQRIESRSSLAASSYPISIIGVHDLEKKPMSQQDFFLTPSVISAASPYAIWHLIEIISEINKVHFFVAETAHQGYLGERKYAAILPDVQEFYTMLHPDRKIQFRKKKWP